MTEQISFDQFKKNIPHAEKYSDSQLSKMQVAIQAFSSILVDSFLNPVKRFFKTTFHTVCAKVRIVKK